MSKKEIVLYGCGGAGTELIKVFMNKQPQEGVADFRTTFIDTSRSNLDSSIPEEMFFQINDDLDGSAKVRKSNVGDIRSVIPTIPTKVKPGNFNVVVYALGGGSGSVIGPLLHKELIAQQRNPVISIIIGSSESVQELENTNASIATLDNMARNVSKTAFLVHYQDNGNGEFTSEVDQLCRAFIAKLAILANGQHRGLDTADLAVWARFNEAPSCDVEPQLAMVDIASSMEELEKIQHPIALASISKTKTAAGSVGADYNCYGLFTTPIVSDPSELHYVVHIHTVPALMKHLKDTEAAMRERKRSRPAVKAISGVTDRKADDDGMVT